MLNTHDTYVLRAIGFLQASPAMQEALAEVAISEERSAEASHELTAASDALQRAEASSTVINHAACICSAAPA